ncbi:MAG: hypothetical protein MJZ64_06240 [Paludibacteraceae bacterium]|nr:hypothetical protein [Paludibacteraceae bacterium]
MAQIHDFSIGAHAGVAIYNTKDNLKNLPGAATGIDLAYTARGVIANQTALGIKFGAGIAYAGATQSLPDYFEQYTNTDYYPEMMDYTITAAKYKENQHQIQLEAPIYLSFITYGVTVNIGAKFMMPFFQKRHIDVADAHITAYYPDFWVPVTDYLATGRLENNEYHAKENSNMPKLNALLSIEIGYEWNVGYKNKLGVQAYLDYGIWNNYSNNPSKERLIDVDPILNTEYPVPEIKVNALTDTYSDHVKYISAGIKVYFAFHTEIPRVAPCRCAYD